MSSRPPRTDQTPDPADYLRIGELARRVGVSPASLRAWERRYGLLEPRRTEGGFRLYSDADVERIRAMLAHLERGLSAAESARLVIGAAEVAPEAAPADTVARLRQALDGFDDAGAQAALDGALAALSLDAVISEVVVPYLRELGARWERGEVTVAQEHFASVLIRGRLLGLARAWDRGGGPHALLACAPEELHDLPLIMLGLALRGNGWRISFLGQDTPFDSIVDAARRLSPEAVIVSATMPLLLDRVTDELGRLAEDARLYLGGPGATPAAAAGIGAILLVDDPVRAAASVAGVRPASS